jgi:3-methyladenine DNA glycosylase/8-oxoguanine DNA glycosylase
MPSPGSTLTLATPPGFDLKTAVCSYGYFMLAPNRWEPEHDRFVRVMSDSNDHPIIVTVTQRKDRALSLRTDTRITRTLRTPLLAGLSRTLRVSEDFKAFHKLHPQARRARFGRLLRSPTLFEDIVKTITGCNVAWSSTIRMNQLLCEKLGHGAFPSPTQLAAVTPDWLKENCKVGYRADRIVRLARAIVDGSLDLNALENHTGTTDELLKQLKTIHGIGDYAAANIAQHLGRYNALAIDSETYRHFRQYHHIATPDNPQRLHETIRKHYARFAPYQFLAYWYELWTDYEHRGVSAPN